jgi:cytoskeleton protein RodZ
VSEHDAGEPERSARAGQESGIGATLKLAREQRNLSEIDLARNLRLEPRIIRQLEEERFDELPAPAFVRGYLRSVGKELGLDSARLLELFDAQSTREAPALADFESRPPLEITSDSRIVRYTTAVLLCGLLVLIAMWWRTHSDSFSMLNYLRESNPSAVEPIPPTPPLSYEFPQVSHSEDPFFRAPDSAPLTLAESDDATPTALATDQSATEPSTADSGTADIVINSTADAWVEILDAGGARLFYNLVRPGNEVRITGKRPYGLVIGNAPAVRLAFEGRKIDLAPLARDGVVKTTLGGPPPSGEEPSRP